MRPAAPCAARWSAGSPFGTLVLVAHDWDDKEAWLRSLELFATEVVPALGGQG